MNVPVRVTPLARDDVRQGQRYFEGCRAGLGDEFVDEVLAMMGHIGDMPLGYVVYYRSDGKEAEVLAVLHGGRSPETWQARAGGEQKRVGPEP